jgi:TonB family protein
MERRSTTFTVALCISLIVHMLGLSAMAWWFVAHTPPPKLAAIDRWKVLTAQLDKVPPRLPTAPPPPPPRMKKKQPPPKFDQEKPQEMPRDDSGEANGTGTANRSTPGIKPMQAPKGYEQADLMRDLPDDAMIDPNSPLPAAAGEKVGTNARPKSSAQAGRYTPDFVAESLAPADPNADVSKPLAMEKGIGPMPLTMAANAPVPSGSPQPVTKAAPANQSQLAVPQAIRGHHATSSDAESVAFAKAESVTLQAGKVEGRHGLKVTPRIPRLGLASEHDLDVLGELHMVIGALADADGNVIDVEILQSSGSPNIDRDYENSVYNWTFEAPKDKDGHPLENKWTINIVD